MNNTLTQALTNLRQQYAGTKDKALRRRILDKAKQIKTALEWDLPEKRQYNSYHTNKFDRWKNNTLFKDAKKALL